ncbi:MAG: xanthine dehydrogenase accessory factor [Gammaproteobacteria bacterium]|jgi:xanthine dehydrogenase accessory factor
MKRETIDHLLRARESKRALALLTYLNDGAQCFFDPSDSTPSVATELAQAALQVLQSDRSGTVNTAQGPVFIQAFNPPLRLVIIGAVHIAQALAPMAIVAGYQVSVVDPRLSFATAERFPGVDLHTDWPDEVLQSMHLDSRTAVITLTHDPKIDDPALHAALAAPVFYIGCLGSKRTHAGRLERLRSAGFGDDDLTRIFGPLGLAIGARSPAEIALSALAQLTARLRGSALA